MKKEEFSAEKIRLMSVERIDELQKQICSDILENSMDIYSEKGKNRSKKSELRKQFARLSTVRKEKEVAK